MLSRSIILKAGFGLGLLCLGAIAPAAAQGYSQEQQQLCSGDAFRLCGPEIPDVDRVTACMVRQRALLSPGCQSVFRYNAPVVAEPVRTTTRPISVRSKAMKASKARKAKKPQR